MNNKYNNKNEYDDSDDDDTLEETVVKIYKKNSIISLFSLGKSINKKSWFQPIYHLIEKIKGFFTCKKFSITSILPHPESQESRHNATVSAVQIRAFRRSTWKPPSQYGLANSNRIIPEYYFTRHNYDNIFEIDYLYMIIDDIRNMRPLNRYQIEYINELDHAKKIIIIEELTKANLSLLEYLDKETVDSFYDKNR